MATDQSPPLIVRDALNRALAGDPAGGGELLLPLIEESARECYALCVMLASTCTYGTRPLGPAAMWRLQVDDVRTGLPGAPDDLADGFGFAAQFVTAYANRDSATTQALFGALARDMSTEAGACRVYDGVIALYAMAIAAVRALLAEERATRNQEGN